MRLVTETIQDQPEVLVVGSSPLSSVVVAVLKKNGFQATQSQSWPGSKKEWYKVVLVTDWLDTVQSISPLLTQLINQQLKPWIVSWELSSGLVGSEDWRAKYQQQQEVLKLINQRVVDRAWLHIYDPIDHPDFIRSVLTTTSPVNTTIYPVLSELAGQAISQRLISPWDQREYYWRGPATSLDRIVDRGTAKTPATTDNLTELSPVWKGAVVLKDVPAVIEWVKNHPYWSRMGKDLSYSPTPDFAPTQLVEPLASQAKQKQIKIDKSFNVVEKSLPNHPVTVSTKLDESVKNDNRIKINQQIDTLFQDQRVVERVQQQNHTIKVKKKVRRQTRHQRTVFHLSMVIVGVVFGVMMLLSSLIATNFIILKRIDRITALISSGEQVNVGDWERLVSWWGGVQIQAYQSVIGDQFLVTAAANSKLFQHLLHHADNQLSFANDSAVVWQQLVGQVAGDSLDSLDQLSLEAEKQYKTLSQTQAELEGGVRAAGVLTELRLNLAKFQQVKPALKLMLGQEGRVVVAVVLQNSAELRPGGGYVEGVVLLVFDHGSLIDYQVYSTSYLDQQTTGEVAGWEEVQKYLGGAGLSMGDMTWQPDFPTNAELLAQTIERSTGYHVDVVMGSTTQFIADLLEVVGPVEMAQYNEVVSAKNIWEKTVFHSELPSANSLGKETYYVNLVREVMTRLLVLNPDQINQMMTVVARQLKQKQLVVSSPDPNIQSSLLSLGWSGGVAQPVCPLQFSEVPCDVDYFMAVETNVGANRANFSVAQQTDRHIELSEDMARHEQVTTYSNSAHTNAWPLGAYRAYLRYLLPLTAENIRVEIDGLSLSAPSLTTTTAYGYLQLGFLLEVPTQTTKVVRLTYDQPLLTAETSSYVYYEQPQIGRSEIDQKLSVTLLNSLIPLVIAPQAEVRGNVIEFSNPARNGHFVGIINQKGSHEKISTNGR